MIAVIAPVLVLVVDALFILLVSAGFPHVLSFVDYATLIAVPLAASLSASAGFGWRRAFAAWGAPLRPEADPRALRAALAWTGSLAAWILSYTMLAVCAGLVLTFSTLSDPSKVGPNLAVSILSIGYGAIALMILVLPFRTIAARRLAELEGSGRLLDAVASERHIH